MLVGHTQHFLPVRTTPPSIPLDGIIQRFRDTLEVAKGWVVSGKSIAEYEAEY
jgi:hypothetical protein